jgi:hypothetical protein
MLPMLERLGDEVERTRVLANLSECNLRLGNLDQALEDARLALSRYQALRMEAKRSEAPGPLAWVHLRRGESEIGLSALDDAAASFEIRGMTGDAGFVKT